jgi:hypothetical protein
MTKQDFIALANAIKAANAHADRFTDSQLDTLADFCKSQNPAFKRDRWLGYINGENGPSGGAVKR